MDGQSQVGEGGGKSYPTQPIVFTDLCPQAWLGLGKAALLASCPGATELGPS